VATAAALAGAALADDIGIGDFAGQWVGKVTVETMSPTDFPTSLRDAGVTVTPSADGGFALEWSTVKRESGDPERPDEAIGETQLTFTATAPARWTAGPGNPVAGQALWTARLQDRTLTVVGYTIMPDGRAEMQTYQRTLDGDAMALNYTRVVDGALARRAAGALTRFAR
jgi:hypothetical protein